MEELIGKIHHESNIKTLARMPDSVIDFICTSPPYDDMDEDFNPLSAKGMREYEGYSWDFKTLATELYRVMAPGGVLVWIVNDPTIDGSESLASCYQKIYFRRVGFLIHDSMFYETHKMPATHNRYEQCIEYMFVLAKGTPKTFNPIKVPTLYPGTVKRYDYNADNLRASAKESGSASRHRRETRLVAGERIKPNFWRINSGWNHSSEDEIAFQHPAIFPEQLAADHIKSWTNEGDLVYEPFCGSGTVPKMCHQLNRRWIASEISEEYCKVANERLKPYLEANLLF